MSVSQSRFSNLNICRLCFERSYRRFCIQFTFFFRVPPIIRSSVARFSVSRVAALPLSFRAAMDSSWLRANPMSELHFCNFRMIEQRSRTTQDYLFYKNSLGRRTRSSKIWSKALHFSSVEVKLKLRTFCNANCVSLYCITYILINFNTSIF